MEWIQSCQCIVFLDKRRLSNQHGWFHSDQYCVQNFNRKTAMPNCNFPFIILSVISS